MPTDYSLFDLIEELGYDPQSVVRLDGPKVNGYCVKEYGYNNGGSFVRLTAPKTESFSFTVNQVAPSVSQFNSQWLSTDCISVVTNPEKDEYIMTSDPFLAESLKEEMSKRGYISTASTLSFKDADSVIHGFSRDSIRFEGDLQDKWEATFESADKSCKTRRIQKERNESLYHISPQTIKNGGPNTIRDILNKEGFNPNSYVKLEKGEHVIQTYPDGKKFQSLMKPIFKDWRGAYFIQMHGDIAFIGDSETFILTKDKELINIFKTKSGYNYINHAHVDKPFEGFADDEMQTKWEKHCTYAKKVSLQIKKEASRSGLSEEEVMEARAQSRQAKRNMTTKRTPELEASQNVLRAQLKAKAR